MNDQDPTKARFQLGWGSGLSRYSNSAPAAQASADARLAQVYEQARADLHRGRADLARDALGELARALPDNPNVKILVQQLPVIAFQYPAHREACALSPRAPPSQRDVDLVAFHVDLPRAPSGIHEPIDYMAVLGLSFESARIRAPLARRILVTDEATAVPDAVGADEVVRFPIDKTRLMFERMRVQELFLAGRAAGRLSVLMDSDVVVNQDPSAIFADNFDVGLTWRPEFPDVPFNGGMILVAEGPGGAKFFRKALACYEAMAADAAITEACLNKDIKAWWGDQFALAALVGHRAYAERTTDALNVDGIPVRFFPCDEYNHTFDPKRRYQAEELQRKFFVHFKGNRKAIQSHYLEMMRAGKL